MIMFKSRWKNVNFVYLIYTNLNFLLIYIFINRFLQQMIVTLEPFETITRKISGAKYPTLSLVVPYMYILKNHFASNEEENESLDTYLSLVYGSNGEEEDSEIVSDDEYIPSDGTR